MGNETNAGKAFRVFDVGKCRARIRAASNLVDCLALEQADFCGSSLKFAGNYFCIHPHQKDFIEITEKLRSASNSTSNVSQSDIQE